MNEQLPAVQTASREVSYVPWGADEQIKLSTTIIRDFVAVATKDGDLPDDRDCMRFLMLCRSQKLNPFAGDVFLIGWKDNRTQKVNWNLVTAQTAFMKRAETHPEFNGIRSGVIVRDGGGHIVEREGDFTYDDDKLLGGWSIVSFKQRQVPMTKRVKLTTYQKTFEVWAKDPAGMICKVAEVHALRDSFPTLLGGLYLREEADILAATEVTVKRPDFGPERMLTGGNGPTPTVETPAARAVAPQAAAARAGQTAKPKQPVQKQDTTTNRPPKTASYAPGGVETAPTVANDPPAQAAAQDMASEGQKGGEQEAFPDFSEPGDSTQEEEAPKPAEFAPVPGEPDHVTAIRFLMHRDGISVEQLDRFAIASKIVIPANNEKTFSQVSKTKLKALANAWPRVIKKIQAA